MGRQPRQRATNYDEITPLQHQRAFGANVLLEPSYTSAKKYERTGGKKTLYRPGLEKDEVGAIKIIDDGDNITSADII